MINKVQNSDFGCTDATDFVEWVQEEHDKLMDIFNAAPPHETIQAYKVVKQIDNLMEILNRFRLEVDPDPRAQIRRAGSYERWNELTN